MVRIQPAFLTSKLGSMLIRCMRGLQDTSEAMITTIICRLLSMPLLNLIKLSVMVKILLPTLSAYLWHQPTTKWSAAKQLQLIALLAKQVLMTLKNGVKQWIFKQKDAWTHFWRLISQEQVAATTSMSFVRLATMVCQLQTSVQRIHKNQDVKLPHQLQFRTSDCLKFSWIQKKETNSFHQVFYPNAQSKTILIYFNST